MMGRPILFVFVDLQNSDTTIVSDSYHLVEKTLPEIGDQFFNRVIVTYADNTKFNKQRKLLGIKHSRYYRYF